MAALFFDSASLFADRIRTKDGVERSFADLGVAGTAILRLHARELTVEGAPADRNVTLVADRLIVKDPRALAFTDPGTRSSPFPEVEIWAQHIDGPLSIVCRGKKGQTGPKGPQGTPAVFGFDHETKKRTLEVEAGPGGRGGPGLPGGPGGRATISFVTATQAPSASAPGGEGGDGGPGGLGGKSGQTSHGPSGPKGPRGPAGPPGAATVRAFPTPLDFWAAWGGAAGEHDEEWAKHRLHVAEHLYCQGTPEALVAAREHLELLAKRPGANLARVQTLLKQLREHVTYAGLPRDLDVTPDVAFVAQDNDDLFQAAQLVLNNAQSIASAAEVQGTFAAFMRLNAQQGENTFQAAGERVKEAQAGVTTAVSATDIARGRVENLSTKVKQLTTTIQKEQEGPGGFGVVLQIVELGIAVGQVAVGVGAIAAVGRGFAVLQKAQQSAQTTFEVIKDIKDKLKDPSLKAFKTGLKDLPDAGKSIFHLGKLISELDGIKSSHPDAKVRELADAQRERLLLEREVGLSLQMEKEAKLGVGAAVAEQNAIRANINLSLGLAQQLEKNGRMSTDPVLTALLTSVRQLLDALSINAFRTLRAREIYLGLDPVEIVRHDLGHLHPDRERMLTPAQHVREIAAPVAARALQIIQWSSLVDEMGRTDGLSRTPVPFWFLADDPQALAPFKASSRFAFYVPVEDLFEEDGSQAYEVKFDSATVILHGARILQGSGQSIKLRQLGRWSFRRRPDGQNPAGQVKDFALPPREVHLNCRQVGDAVEATLAPPANPRAEPPFSLWGRGVAGDWELADEGGIDLSGLTRIEVGFMTQALTGTAFRTGPAGARRLLRALPGWPPAKVPPRGSSPYYAGGVGGVAVVGLELV